MAEVAVERLERLNVDEIDGVAMTIRRPDEHAQPTLHAVEDRPSVGFRNPEPAQGLLPIIRERVRRHRHAALVRASGHLADPVEFGPVPDRSFDLLGAAFDAFLVSFDNHGRPIASPRLSEAGAQARGLESSLPRIVAADHASPLA